MSVLRPGGVLITLLPSAEDTRAAAEKAQVCAAHLAVEHDQAGMRAVAELVDRGRLRAHVSGTFPLAEGARAHALAETVRQGAQFTPARDDPLPLQRPRRASGTSVREPAPIPNSSRPPETASTVAEILASMAGGRNLLLVTITPSRNRSVRAARADRSVQPSKVGPFGSPPSGMRWSNSQACSI
ncbi:hypothetical protein GCM10010246_77230 [Streptomyces cuspidosporus]|uniref:Alcohol dehydrogenase-like C-terminal domain-containing protein n=1 Tax=Streptomyces cuspidosporus TaxID=66882 RepID=A0ABP5U6U6_9ACTN